VTRLVRSTDYTRLDETRVLMLLAPVSFDISMFEIWGALLNGATLVVPPWDQLPELSRLGDILKATGVSTLQMTPALFNTIIDEDPAILAGVGELTSIGR
jgi:non-ribosomal peptide synthetase component F